MAISFSRPDPEASSPSAEPFRYTRRGFDPDEVRSALRALQNEIEVHKAREQQLLRELAAATRPQVELASVSPETLAELVGEETVRLLSEAREAVAPARARAEQEAVQIIAAAYEEASRVRDAAKNEAKYLQQTTAEQVESELASARGRGLEMVTEAREYREKVLADLAKRRELAREQVRALLDGRDHLLRAFEVARLAAVDIIVELEQAAPRDSVDPADGALDQDVLALSIYDADADVTPAAGMTSPVTSGPVLLVELADGDVAEGGGALESRSDDAARQATLFEVQFGDGPAGEDHEGDDDETSGRAVAETVSLANLPPNFRHRSETLSPLVDSLSKQLRRVALDEQNDVLAAVRRLERITNISELLPDEDAHLGRYHSCVLAEVADAFAAGAASLGATVSTDSITLNAAVVGRIAEELVLPLRERLERVIDSSEGNRFELSAFLRSAYREWKQRFDRLAEELLVLAYGYGSYAALAPGALAVWQPEPGVAACPEASVNVGVVTRVPDEFPSGHRHPPSSNSCRCLIARVPE